MSAANRLVTIGFTANATNADKNYNKTLIIYDNENKKDAADAISKKLGVGNVSKNSGDYVFSADILVIIGSDFDAL